MAGALVDLVVFRVSPFSCSQRGDPQRRPAQDFPLRSERVVGLEQIMLPSATAGQVDLTVVQAMFAVLPELDRIRTHAKSSPAQRTVPSSALRPVMGY